ncbi:hypothetical protein HERIO_1776 [Hepatospora eriocheir]|uniref:Uncharacterized protein n=1 Tax=Hepatospora eriocheir TaxID=1081669 RepID=A0A1X0Q9C0_9MICR|nr:hypothetical protein HERIO_1776 [Hepatospora eriocheir]
MPQYLCVFCEQNCIYSYILMFYVCIKYGGLQRFTVIKSEKQKSQITVTNALKSIQLIRMYYIPRETNN